jgi:hypothetical protein
MGPEPYILFSRRISKIRPVQESIREFVESDESVVIPGRRRTPTEVGEGHGTDEAG